MRGRKLAAVLVGVLMLVGLGGSPVQAVEPDPAGPPCRWYLPSGCDAANWYQDIRGYGMEGSADKLRRGIVSAFGPYLSSGNQSSVEKVVAAYGGRAGFRMCARNAAVAFASQVAWRNSLISSWNSLFKAAKAIPGAGKTVNQIWSAIGKPLTNLASHTVLKNEASTAVQVILGCS